MHDATKLAQVDALRTLSLGLVLLFHFGVAGFSNGFLGVDLFFVISGYLIHRLYFEPVGRGGISGFYRRRILRIVPAYILVIATVACASVFALPSEFHQSIGYALWALAGIPNIRFWFDDSYNNIAYFRPLLHLWSLGVEIQFYLLYPAIALIVRRWRGALYAGLLAGLLLYLLIEARSEKTAFFLTPCRLWQFMLGMIAADLSARVPRAASGFAILALVPAITLAPRMQLEGAALVLVVSGLGALALCRAGSIMSGTPVCQGARAISAISYEAYLVHVPILYALSYEPLQRSGIAPNGVPETLRALVLITAAAVALRFGARRLVGVGPGRLRRVAALGSIACAGVFALATFGTEMNRGMVSQRILNASASWTDRLPTRCPLLGRLRDRSAPACLIAGKDGPAALLVGDSHADMLKGELGRAIELAGGRLFLLVSHAPVGLPGNLQTHYQTPERLLATARSLGVGTLVVHSHDRQFDAEAVIALARMADREGIVVSAILPVPLYRDWVPHTLYEQAMGRTGELAITADDYLGRERRKIEYLVSAAREIEGLRLFFPHEILCRPLCRIADAEGRPLYWDNQHLTQTGVRQIAPLLAGVAATVR